MCPSYLAKLTNTRRIEDASLTLASKIQAWLENHTGPDGALEARNQYEDPLSVAIRQESNNHADVLDGSVCRAVVYYHLGEYDYALSQVPESMHRVKVPSKGTGEAAWGAVTVTRGNLIRGLSLEAKDDHEGAATTYRSTISYLSSLVGVPSLCPALRRSLEEMLVHICLYFAISTGTRPSSDGEAIAAFQILSRLLHTHSGQFLSLHGVNTKETPRQLWKSYYQTLSRIVARGLVYHPNPMNRDHETLDHRGLLGDQEWKTSRQQQKVELRRVETNYESILMKETSFPKANEGNPEVEEWVTQVMANWTVMCGPNWTDEELGTGGKTAIGRTTLDILYRAATKTFHSTQILRCLFIVHAFLSEFELAFKTFDSYVEIMERGKTRKQKSGSAGLIMDDDDTYMLVAAEAIRVACRYGPRAFGQKAFGIGEMMQSWLETNSQEPPLSPTSPTSVTTTPRTANPTFSDVSRATLVVAYRAIGISQANWSHTTFDPAVRTKCQEMAADNLSRSLRTSINDVDSTETFFALGLVFSEMRRIPEAVAHIERAVKSPAEGAALRSPDGVSLKELDFSREATSGHGLESKKIPLRHLLALLYSIGAMDDEKSLHSAEEALYPLSTHSLQRSTSLGSLRLNATGGESRTDSAVHKIDPYDKKNLIQLKMTEIVLTSISYGSERAVKECSELLALYKRLYGSVETLKVENLAVPVQSPPKSSRGTIRSVFSRDKSSKRSLHRSTFGSVKSRPETVTANQSRPTTAATVPPPQIRVTNGNQAADGTEPILDHDAVNGSPRSKRDSIRTSPRKGQRQGSVLQKKRRDGRPYSSAGDSTNAAGTNSSAPPVLNIDTSVDLQKQSSAVQPNTDETIFDEVPHNMAHNRADPPAGHTDQPPHQDKRMPALPPALSSTDSATSPAPIFLELQHQRHKITVLVSVWLFVARHYTAVSHFEDSVDATKEAFALVQELEGEIANVEDPSVARMQEEGWGGGSSVERLWADVWTEQGMLQQQQSQPHDALDSFEKALSHSPQHVPATLQLSKILLEVYAQTIPAERPDPEMSVFSQLPDSGRSLQDRADGVNGVYTSHVHDRPNQTRENAEKKENSKGKDDPMTLHRLTARDRAFALLESLVKRGDGWDNAEAWLLMGRAYEESGIIEAVNIGVSEDIEEMEVRGNGPLDLHKEIRDARGAYERAVQLADTAGVREWSVVGAGGYVL
ncbi:MAG: hypothetical protein M1831_001995 [Alyxoria varia]|nr:MAG: hypothetical protein M1831_001995 [Alyxoria varia]